MLMKTPVIINKAFHTVQYISDLHCVYVLTITGTFVHSVSLHSHPDS